MANKLILKRSSVASKVPLATDLEPGELAVNLADQKLYSKKPDGTVILVGSGLGGAGDVQGPASATDNAITRFDGATGKIIQNSIATIDDNGVAQFAGINGGQLAGLRNAFVNGKMTVSQEQQSFTANASTAGYAADQWRVSLAPGSTASILVSRTNNTPTVDFDNSLNLSVSTADTSVDAGDFIIINGYVEGYDARRFIGKDITISFWAYSTLTGIYCIAIRNSAANRSYVAEFNLNTSNAWQKITITIPGGLITDGTWNWTNGIGINFTVCLQCGTTLGGATANTWITGNKIATSNQVNWAGATGRTFGVTGFQIETGAVATPFEHLPQQVELAICRRYFYQMVGSDLQGGGMGNANGQGFPQTLFIPPMRATPTAVAPTAQTANCTVSLATSPNTLLVVATYTSTTLGAWAYNFSQGTGIVQLNARFA